MDVKLKVLSEALVTCLDDLPDNMSLLGETTSLIQQLIAQLLHKLSLGKVTKVYFDTLADDTVAVKTGTEDVELTTTTPPDIIQPVNSMLDDDQQINDVKTVDKLTEQHPTHVQNKGENASTGMSLSEMEIEGEVDEIPEFQVIEQPSVDRVSTVYTGQEAMNVSHGTAQKPIVLKHEDSKQVRVQGLYHCSYCSKKFKDRAKLRRHLLVHTGQRPFYCPRCPKTFQQKTHLQDHMKCHTGVKDHKCPDCGRSFSVNRNLVRHRRIHTGERPYSCDICSSTFISSDKLYFHKLQHSGQKPYQCSICSKCFRRPDYLKGHKCKVTTLSRTLCKNNNDQINYIEHSEQEEPNIKKEKEEDEKGKLNSIRATTDNKGNTVLIVPKNIKVQDTQSVTKGYISIVKNQGNGCDSVEVKQGETKQIIGDKTNEKIEKLADSNTNHNRDTLSEDNLNKSTGENNEIEIVLISQNDDVKTLDENTSYDSDNVVSEMSNQIKHQAAIPQSLQTLVEAAYVLQQQNK